jgi:hypothetical protein
MSGTTVDGIVILKKPIGEFKKRKSKIYSENNSYVIG